jgi:hypothetical protein
MEVEMTAITSRRAAAVARKIASAGADANCWPQSIGTPQRREMRTQLTKMLD